jgi:hypothetical protein
MAVTQNNEGDRTIAIIKTCWQASSRWYKEWRLEVEDSAPRVRETKRAKMAAFMEQPGCKVTHSTSLLHMPET